MAHFIKYVDVVDCRYQRSGSDVVFANGAIDKTNRFTFIPSQHYGVSFRISDSTLSNCSYLLRCKGNIREPAFFMRALRKKNDVFHWSRVFDLRKDQARLLSSTQALLGFVLQNVQHNQKPLLVKHSGLGRFACLGFHGLALLAIHGRPRGAPCIRYWRIGAIGKGGRNVRLWF